MPFLVVLGTGTWGYGRATGAFQTDPKTGGPLLDWSGKPKPIIEMRTYHAGQIYEVDDETAEHVRKANLPLVRIMEVEPIIVKRESPGPLSWEDLRLPSDGAYVLEESDDGLQEAEPPDEGIPMDWPCGLCPARFPSAPARDRHEAMNHPPSA